MRARLADTENEAHLAGDRASLQRRLSYLLDNPSRIRHPQSVSEGGKALNLGRNPRGLREDHVSLRRIRFAPGARSSRCTRPRLSGALVGLQNSLPALSQKPGGRLTTGLAGNTEEISCPACLQGKLLGLGVELRRSGLVSRRRSFCDEGEVVRISNQDLTIQR